MATEEEVRVDERAARAIGEGHPWVYREAVRAAPDGLRAGAAVGVRGADWLARGLWDPGSSVAVRILTRDRKERVDAGLFARRIARAAERRARRIDLAETNAWRVVNAEGDGLPGLVVEMYDRYAAVFLATEALRPWLPAIADGLVAALSPAGIHEKRGGDEGGRGELVAGESAPAVLPVREQGLTYLVRLPEGGKTGLFLDTREVRRRLRGLAAGRAVLNTFSFTGSLSVAAAAGGATRVTSVDLSPKAMAFARENFEANGAAPGVHETIVADVPAALADLGRAGRRFDVAILDPPTFSRARSGGRRGGDETWTAPGPYRNLVALSVPLLARDGILVAGANTRRISTDDLVRAIRDGGRDAGRDLAVLEAHGPPADFPTLAALPESRHLKFLLCAAIR